MVVCIYGTSDDNSCAVLSVLGDETSEKTEEEDEVTDSFLFWMSSCKTVFSEATVLLTVGSVVAAVRAYLPAKHCLIAGRLTV